MKDYSNSSIDKAAEILDFLSENPQSQSLNQISKSLDIPKASTFRILFSLEKWDMVEKDENEEYRLGKSLIYYGARASKNMNIVTLAKEYIDPFSKEIEESVNLNIEYRQYAVNIYKSTIKESGIVSNLIPISPLNCSGSGKILLAQKSDEEIKAYFQSPNTEERTIYSIMDYEKFEIEKQNLKKHGILYDNEEYEYGLLCIAAPIYLKNQVIAVVSLTGPKRRIQEKGMELLENKLKNVANKISAELQKVGM